MINVIFKRNSGVYGNPDAIENVIHYIYRVNEKKNLPVFCYDPLQYPPTYQTLIQDFHTVYEKAGSPCSRQLWHFDISFPPDIPLPDDAYLFIDRVAELCSEICLVCYALHRRKKAHPNRHFHLVLSSVNYQTGEVITEEQLSRYFLRIHELAKSFGIHLQWIGMDLPV